MSKKTKKEVEETTDATAAPVDITHADIVESLMDELAHRPDAESMGVQNCITELRRTLDGLRALPAVS